jgi:hypothetical protein
LGITVEAPLSIAAITELVVPRSMPTALAMPPSCQAWLLLVLTHTGHTGTIPRVLRGRFPRAAYVMRVKSLRRHQG